MSGYTLNLDVIDAEGVNVTASGLLDADHEIEVEDEDTPDCGVCGYAVGWREDTGGRMVHATRGTSIDIAADLYLSSRTKG